MKVIQRRQITEVITRRSVTHTLEVDGVKYGRTKKVSVYVPNMDCNVQTSKPEIKWYVYTEPRTIRYLLKKEVVALKLEEMFEALDINDRNGNGNQS